MTSGRSHFWWDPGLSPEALGPGEGRKGGARPPLATLPLPPSSEPTRPPKGKDVRRPPRACPTSAVRFRLPSLEVGCFFSHPAAHLPSYLF